jgi:hypothetical protein
MWCLIDTNHSTIAPPIIDFDIPGCRVGSFRVDLDMREPSAHTVLTDFTAIAG